MKAWLVSPKGYDPFFDDRGQIVIRAETRGKAKAVGVLEFGDAFVDVYVVRAPEFDDDGDLVSDRLYIENGWWVECVICDQWLGKGQYDHETDELVEIHYTSRGSAQCAKHVQEDKCA